VKKEGEEKKHVGSVMNSSSEEAGEEKNMLEVS
jgi:hypothetical protein